MGNFMPPSLTESLLIPVHLLSYTLFPVSMNLCSDFGISGFFPLCFQSRICMIVIPGCSFCLFTWPYTCFSFPFYFKFLLV